MKLSFNLLLVYAIITLGLDAKADLNLLIDTKTIHSGCFKDLFYVRIDKLLNLTYSRVRVVGLKTYNLGFCNVFNQYIHSLGQVEAKVSLKLENIDYPIKYFPCNSSMKTCKAIYRKAIQETVTVKLDKLTFYNQTEIHNSRVDRIEEWSSNSCPPYHPDCDL